MSYRHKDGDYAFEINKCQDLLNITAIDRHMMEEYNIIIKPDSTLFKDKKIITSIDLLYDALHDGFEKLDNSVSVTFDIRKDEQDACPINKCIIYISINAYKIKEYIRIVLSFVDKHITPRQVKENIDLIFENYATKFSKEIDNTRNDVMNALKKSCDNINNDYNNGDNKIVKTFNDNINALKSKFKIHVNEFNETKNKLIKHVDDIDRDLERCINKIPVLTFKYKIYTHYGMADFVSYVTNNITYLYISSTTVIKDIHMNNPSEYLCYGNYIQSPQSHNVELINFNVNDLKHLTNLTHIIFGEGNNENGFSFTNLNFLAVTDKLKSITINNVKTLKKIGYLVNFENLENITINYVCNVSDLYELEKCKNLKSLVLPTGTNTGCFRQVTQFDIKMS